MARDGRQYSDDKELIFSQKLASDQRSDLQQVH